MGDDTFAREFRVNSVCSLPTASAGIDADDMSSQLKLLSLLDNPAVVVAAAAAGDADTIRDFLSRNPHHVCRHRGEGLERGRRTCHLICSKYMLCL